MRLAQGWTGAHQGSLGTRLAQGWYSILALTVLIHLTSNSFCLRRLNVSSFNFSDRNDVIGISPTQPQFKYKYIVSIHGASK